MSDKSFLIEMGKRIMLRRKELKFTQERLAEYVGVSLQTISCIELGKKAIRPNNLVKLCDALKTTPDYILTGKKSSIDLESTLSKLLLLSEAEYNIVNQLINHFLNNK